MPRPRAATISISKPYDARHVSGINIPGLPPTTKISIPTIPIQPTPSPHLPFSPDEPPTHINISQNPTPKRSNTIAHTLSRPSLRLKTSISRLRGRARALSSSPDAIYSRRERARMPEMPSAFPPVLPMIETSNNNDTKSLAQALSSISRSPSPSSIYTTPSPPPVPSTSMSHPTLPPTIPHPHPQRPSRPKRADSGVGTAIDFDDVPVEERPLGFQEILRVRDLKERLVLYRRAREYWATADHGLGEWVGRAGAGGRGRVVVV